MHPESKKCPSQICVHTKVLSAYVSDCGAGGAAGLLCMPGGGACFNAYNDSAFEGGLLLVSTLSSESRISTKKSNNANIPNKQNKQNIAVLAM